jgi:predicted RNA-binding Zn ribbon-like protein
VARHSQKDFHGILPAPIRLGDHLALDFLNSIASPKGTPIEWITDGGSLLRWMVNTEVLDKRTAEEFLAMCTKSDLDSAAREARKLREWFRASIQASKRLTQPILDADGVIRLNKLLARDASFRRIIESEGNGLQIATEKHWTKGNQLLVPIAQAVAELLTECDRSLVRACEGPACTLWFYDQTKSHQRRWCSQAICGNRAKVAAFRERKRNSH